MFHTMYALFGGMWIVIDALVCGAILITCGIIWLFGGLKY